AWRRLNGCFAAGLARSNSAALQKIEFPILEGPLDVTPRPIDLLALQGKLAQGGELRVVEAELVDLLERYWVFEGAPVRERADGAGDIGGGMDIEKREVLTGETCRSAVFVNGRRPDRKRRRQGSDGLCQFFNRLLVTRRYDLDQVA